MTNTEIGDAELKNVNQEGVGNQVKDDAQATQKTEGPILSSSISSDYAAKYLNFDNIPPVDTEVVLMLDIDVQHKFPRTSPLLTIPVSVIPEHTIVNPPKIVKTTSSATISSLLSSLFPHLQQLTPIPMPTTTEATTPTTVVPVSETLTAFHQRITNLEKDVKELKTVDHTSALLSTIKSEVPKVVKEYLGTSLNDSLQKVLQKHSVDLAKEHSVPAEVVKRLRQQYVPEKSSEDIRKIKMEHERKQQDPKETITLSDTSALEEFNQKQDDLDKDEGPSAGSDRGLKRQKINKDAEPSKKAKPPKKWISIIAQVEKPPLTFNELMSTTIDFSAYVMNNLKIDNLTQEHLVGPAFNLLKGTCKSQVELEYHFEECYKVVTNRLDWNNPEGQEYPFDLRKPPPLIEDRGCQVVPVDYFINNDLEYLKGGSSSRKYMTSTTKTKATI
ncbi:hypothetical protein Tco_1300589 [Tanacetum coccineum]